MPKSTKAHPKSKNKKTVSEDILNKYQGEIQEDKPKKRLRRNNRRQSSSEDDYVPGKSDEEMAQEQLQADIEDEEDIDVGDKFKVQDDEDIEKEKIEAENKKKSKKLKGNQEISKFMGSAEKKGARSKKKEEKEQGRTTQTNLLDMLNRKKQKDLQEKQRRQEEEQRKAIQAVKAFEKGEMSAEDDSDYNLAQLKAQQAYYQNGGKKVESESKNQSKAQEDEQALIQKAKKLSLLEQSTKKNEKIQQSPPKQNKPQISSISFEDFAVNYEDEEGEMEKIGKKGNKNVKKTATFDNHSSEIVSDNAVPKGKKGNKSEKKKATAKKQKPDGPLNDEVIAFTGQTEPYTKDELIELFQKLGAQTPKSLTKKTTILIQGAYVVDHWKKKTGQDITTTSKSTEAIKKGIKIIANKDIDDFLIQKTGKSLAEHFEVKNDKIDNFINQNKIVDQSVDQKMDLEIPNETDLKQKVQSADFHRLWTEKHKPNSLSEIIGQTKQIRDLREWLGDWEQVILKGHKKNVEPSRGFLPSGSMNSRAALLSGDPGLGKTTTARLLALELNYSVTQFNASDIRNKKGVQLLETNSFGLVQTSDLVKNVVIMDEVDGMSKGDRGGITEIINLIKHTTVPIICICNDRQAEKIRSLAGHCLDVKFHKPDKRLIVRRLHQILKQEGGQASEVVLNRIVETFQNDMRQILTYLELMFKTKTSQMDASSMKATDELKFVKDGSVLLTHFDATSKLLNRHSLRQLSLSEKMDCYFIDSDMVPIDVFENYLGSAKRGKMNRKEFHRVVKATEGFVQGDMIDSKIRKQQQWSLMPSAGYLLSVYPAEMVGESLGFPVFPAWLGKFSSERKQKRLLKELKHCIHKEHPTTSRATRFHYAPMLYYELNQLLKKDKVEEALDFMESYNISPTIMNENILPLTFNSMKGTLLSQVTTSTKAKLTRAYNKRHEDAKIIKAKKAAGKAGNANKAEHKKFNPVLEEFSDDEDFINDEEEEDEENSAPKKQMAESKKQKGAKKKAIKKGAKASKRTMSMESQSENQYI